MNELVAQFFRSEDCPLSVKMVLGGQPAALLRLVAEVARQARVDTLAEVERAIGTADCKHPNCDPCRFRRDAVVTIRKLNAEHRNP